MARILIVAQLPPPVHGSNVMTKILLDSLSSLGHKPVLVEKSFSRTQEDVGRFSLGKIFKIPQLVVRLLHQTYKSKPDLCIFFISLGMGSFLVDAILLAILRLLRVRYLLYAHGVGIQKLYDRSGPLFRPIVRKTCVGAVGALVLGETLKSDLADFMAAERMYVLPNALPDDPDPLSPTKSEMSPIRILFLSNLKRDKGPLEFLKMASQIHTRSQSVRFVLAGPKRGDSFYRELIECIATEGLNEVVELRGALYDEEKRQAFRQSDLFIFPTLNEAFGLVLLEAMQHGLPVVASSLGAIPEIVTEGVTGYLVPPGDIGQLTDRVNLLLCDETARHLMGVAGRRRFKECFTLVSYENRLGEGITYFLALTAQAH
jgi:glycosyltransferase involved in cell wall biosynthesis